MKTLAISFPAKVRYRANQFASKKLSHGRTFEKIDSVFLGDMTCHHYIYHLAYLSDHVVSIEVNGQQVWTKKDGFEFDIVGLEDVGFDENKRQFYSKEARFIEGIVQ